MNDKNFIVICAIISIMFLYVLDNAFIISTKPPMYMIEFDVNNTKIIKPFDCQPLKYDNSTMTLTCTDGEMIRP